MLTNLKLIPSVDSLLGDTAVQAIGAKVPRKLLATAVRYAVNDTRETLKNAASQEFDKDAIHEMILKQVQSRVDAVQGPFYRKAINATGIILHTGLGRAVLPACAIEQIANELAGYSLLQIDLETGQRSKRDERIVWLLQQLTHAESVTVVNNNAAATALVLNTIGKGKEIIVSRGQLVEIGGSFRLPDVMESSGVKLVEVGTTNKTHPQDYVRAINENTAAIMRVHPSNYKITGFTSEVGLKELVQIAHQHNLVMIDDVGAGALMDFSKFGFEYEPTLSDSIEAGADIVTCSGDKLIGGCQAGIILGLQKYIQAIRKNPFARIVRVDKMSLAVLEATLMLFFDEAIAMQQVPTLKMLGQSLQEIESRAKSMLALLRNEKLAAELEIMPGFSQMGSGSLPSQNLQTKLIAITPAKMTTTELSKKLRLYNTPIIARIADDRLLIDPRTLLEGEESIIGTALLEILGTL